MQDDKGSREFLSQRHAEIGLTPTNIIAEVVQRGIGSPPLSSVRLPTGEANEVYSIVAQDGQGVILRISKRGEGTRFEQEKWALEQVRAAGVPTPQVRFLERVQTGDSDLWFMIEEKLHGRQLSTLAGFENIDQERLREIAVRAGSLLAGIHSIRTTGYGPLEHEGKGRYSSWGEYMLEPTEDATLMKIAEQTGIDKDSVASAVSILREHQPVYGKAKPRLLHGDFVSPNVLVIDKDISGIVDMENCMSGDPAHDFAWWNIYDGGKFPLAWLQEGYANKEVFDADFDTRLHLSKLHHRLRSLPYDYRINNTRGTNRIRENLPKDVEYFKRT